jgi:DNA-binding transcriptional MerR regulator
VQAPDEERGHLRIGELSRRTGVAPELLRAWEARYALVSPARTAGGFRLYDAQDERRVRLMLRFLASGVAAAEAARLAVGTPAISGPTPLTPNGSASPADDLSRALDRFDEEAAHAALDWLLSAYGLQIAVRDVILPYFGELGERWAQGAVSVAQEHFATALVRGRLLALARGWGGGDGPRALLACVPDDLHDLGLICFGLALRRHGWRITFLGASSPTETIADCARVLKPAIVAVAASGAVPAERSRDGLAEVALAAPLALGGRGADAPFARSIGARYLPNDPVTAAADVASTRSRL